MPEASNPERGSIKMLLIGDSSSGKTGALMSLAAAGYKLRIVDLDSGAQILHSLADGASGYDKKCLHNIHYLQLTEKMKIVGGRIVPSGAKVWPNMLEKLDKWTEKTPGGDVLDYGSVFDWGPDTILVIDSLTRASDAAMKYVQSLNGRLGGGGTQNEWRRDIGAAQQTIVSLLELITSSAIRCHVIVISHITYVEDGDAPRIDGESAPRTGHPSAIGKSLSPLIPRYFNSMLFIRVEGSGSGTRHVIYTKPQGIVGAKSVAPFSTPASYPIKDGLAKYFEAVLGQKGPAS